MNQSSVLYAIGAAILFGLSTPAAKLLVGITDPWILAGVLYLGAGVGLAAVRLAFLRGAAPAEAVLAWPEVPWLAGAVLAGGVIGPVLLMLGLQRTAASTASLLLTLEGVATAALAWFAFNENYNRRVVLGMACIVIGAAILNWRGGLSFGDPLGPLAIVGACLAWALDNNLTRKISLSDPMQIAMVKGLVAGPVSLTLGLLSGAALPSPTVAAVGAVTGFLGYGVSLALFVLALRQLGTARTGAYFSIAPFVGAAASVPLLGDRLSLPFFVAALLMAVGVWLHLGERHEHEHRHEPLDHEHRHVHDAHHRHGHAPGDPPGEPHSHRHAHEAMLHSHPHVPDSHHRHSHGSVQSRK